MSDQLNFKEKNQDKIQQILTQETRVAFRLDETKRTDFDPEFYSMEKTAEETTFIDQALQMADVGKLSLTEDERLKFIDSSSRNKSHMLVNSKKFMGDSDLMKHVKDTVIEVEKLLNGEFDHRTFGQLAGAYDYAIRACETYCKKKHPFFPKGKARKRMVEERLATLRKEQALFKGARKAFWAKHYDWPKTVSELMKMAYKIEEEKNAPAQNVVDEKKEELKKQEGVKEETNQQTENVEDINLQTEIVEDTNQQTEIVEDTNLQTEIVEDTNQQTGIVEDTNQQTAIVEETNQQTKIVEEDIQKEKEKEEEKKRQKSFRDFASQMKADMEESKATSKKKQSKESADSSYEKKQTSETFGAMYTRNNRILDYEDMDRIDVFYDQSEADEELKEYRTIIKDGKKSEKRVDMSIARMKAKMTEDEAKAKMTEDEAGKEERLEREKKERAYIEAATEYMLAENENKKIIEEARKTNDEMKDYDRRVKNLNKLSAGGRFGYIENVDKVNSKEFKETLANDIRVTQNIPDDSQVMRTFINRNLDSVLTEVGLSEENLLAILKNGDASSSVYKERFRGFIDKMTDLIVGPIIEKRLKEKYLYQADKAGGTLDTRLGVYSKEDIRNEQNGLYLITDRVNGARSLFGTGDDKISKVTHYYEARKNGDTLQEAIKRNNPKIDTEEFFVKTWGDYRNRLRIMVSRYLWGKKDNKEAEEYKKIVENKKSVKNAKEAAEMLEIGRKIEKLCKPEIDRWLVQERHTAEEENEYITRVNIEIVSVLKASFLQRNASINMPNVSMPELPGLKKLDGKMPERKDFGL